MPNTTFECPKCHAVFGVPPNSQEIKAVCSGCESSLDAYFFHAFFNPRSAEQSPQALLDQSEASCFYHPQKQAQKICDGCGRLICGLCAIDLGEKQLCPNCLSSGKEKGKITTLEDSRTLYDSMALSLAVLGIITACTYIIPFMTSLAAIYVSIRYWRNPGSILGANKARFLIAILISLLILGFFAAVIIEIIFRKSVK